jgi:hypothetical protein
MTRGREGTRRTFVAVDVENMAGSPRLSRMDVRLVMRSLEDVLGVGRDVQYALGASSRQNALAIGLEWQGRLLRWLPGPDGADHALEEEMVLAARSGRFSRMVVATCDGGFADALAEVASLGVHTTVVSLVPRVSGRLKMAAHSVRIIAHPMGGWALRKVA